MRVDVLGEVAVHGAHAEIGGAQLGGRRARVALVALALSGRPLTGEQLAGVLWPGELPATWNVALRGVVRGLRAALLPIGGDGQRVIATVASGYQLAPGVGTDLELARSRLQEADALLAQGRHQAALDTVDALGAVSGSRLLPGEDGDWLGAHRVELDALALQAAEVVVACAGSLGDHHRALASARRAVADDPLDERAHRLLMTALDRSGDRAGAVRAFERCRSVLADQLGVDPSAETVEVYLVALRDQPGAGHAPLPRNVSSFVGRAGELAAVTELLNRPGAVTLAGRGGVGKSRLALEAATRRGDIAGGRFWVSLAPVAQDTLVGASVALALGLAVGTEDAASVIAGHLLPLGRTLLVLDGCEAVVDGVASLVTELVAACPQLSIMVTSRVGLGVEGEHRMIIEPLPGTPAGPAVRLLHERVLAAGGELELDELVAPHVAALLGRCGGLPLAIELVAAQLATMAPGDLVDQLDEVLAEDDDRLRAVVRSSYAMLSSDEAAVFRRLGVLDGPVGLPLVRQVASGGGIAPTRVVRILRELAACGLVAVDRSQPRWRYEQDDDLHRFARELLVAAGEERDAYDRLTDAVRAMLPDDARASPAPYIPAVNAVFGSVRSLFAAAMDGRADAARCLELAFRMHRYFATTNVAEGRFWLARMLEVEPAGRWSPYATYALGYLNYWSGDTLEAVIELESVVGMLDGVEDSYAARALIYLAGLLDDLDRGPEAVEYVGRAIGAAAPFDVDLQVAAAMGMGSVLAERGEPVAAGYARDAIELCRRAGSADQLALALPTAAMVCWQVGAHDKAREYVDEARPMHTSGPRIARVVLLSAAAGLAYSDGDPTAAIDVGRQADREASELGVEREVPLIRAVLARALLDAGDVRGAADRALAALDAAAALAFEFPLALCLETVAVVVAHDRSPHVTAGLASDLAALLAAADLIRIRGDRPALGALRHASDELRIRVGLGRPLPAQDAVALARRVLRPVSASV